MTKKECKKEWFLDRYCGQQFAALLEEGRLVEFSCEKEPRSACVGNVYKGRVVNVLAGMNAAFVNCGLAKNGYLSMEETYTDYSKYDGKMGGTRPLDLKVGDEIIVQITKPPRGNKGAKLTTNLSFVGKTIIYLPNTDFLGISRRITDENVRTEFLKKAEEMREREGEGFIIRTQAPFAKQKSLLKERDYLKKRYEETLRAAQKAPVGTLLYEDDDLPERVMRDSYGEEITAFHVGDAALYKRLTQIAKLRGDVPERKIHFHDGDRAMMQEYGISPLVYASAQPVVPLQCGGSLVIERTEAMTVVDVNSASYVGENSHEETVFAVNLEAAKEIARQVRLRNVGGIVVVDFIDMADEEHKQAVTEALTIALSADKAKCHVLPMSELCITQFTRKRVGSENQAFLEKPCPRCGGVGCVPEDVFVVTQLRTRLLECFATGYRSAIIELNSGIMQKILSERIFEIELKTRWKDKRIYLVPHKTYKEEFFTVRGDDATVLHLPDNAQILY